MLFRWKNITLEWCIKLPTVVVPWWQYVAITWASMNESAAAEASSSSSRLPLQEEGSPRMQESIPSSAPAERSKSGKVGKGRTAHFHVGPLYMHMYIFFPFLSKKSVGGVQEGKWNKFAYCIADALILTLWSLAMDVDLAKSTSTRRLYKDSRFWHKTLTHLDWSRWRAPACSHCRAVQLWIFSLKSHKWRAGNAGRKSCRPLWGKDVTCDSQEWKVSSLSLSCSTPTVRMTNYVFWTTYTTTSWVISYIHDYRIPSIDCQSRPFSILAMLDCKVAQDLAKCVCTWVWRIECCRVCKSLWLKCRLTMISYDLHAFYNNVKSNGSWTETEIQQLQYDCIKQASIDYVAAVLVLLNSIVLMMEFLGETWCWDCCNELYV